LQSFAFFLITGKRAFQMHTITGLERLYTNCNNDKYITAKFEAKILSSISRYSKFPTPVEYKSHASRYKLVARLVTEPIKDFPDNSGRSTHRLRLDLPIQTPRSTQNTVSTQRLDAIETSLEAVMDKMTLVVNAVTELQTQIDNTENMQNKMAEIMDMESQRVQNIEQKMESVGTAAVNADNMEHFDVILDRLDYLELKMEDMKPPDVSSFCTINDYRQLELRIQSLETTSPPLSTIFDNRDRRSRNIPQSLSSSLRSSEGNNSPIIIAMAEKIKQLEAQLSIQQTLNVTWQQNIDQMNEKLTKLTAVCQNLNSRLKNHDNSQFIT